MEGGSYQRLESPNVIQIGESSADLPRSKQLQIGNVIFYLFFLLVNILAASGIFYSDPRSERRVHPIRLDPADYTFLIWALILFLATLFALYQTLPHRRTSIPVFGEVNGLFILACLFQVSWVLCVSYEAPEVVPLLFMMLLLVTLISTYMRLHRPLATVSLATAAPSSSYTSVPTSSSSYSYSSSLATPFSRYLCVDLLISVFLAWVAIETALMTSWMLKYQAGWHGNPWNESGWAVVVLAVEALVAMVMLFKWRDGVFGLVISWACFGIAKAQHHIEEIKIAGYVFGGILLITSLLALVLKYRRWEEERSGLKVRVIHP